MYQLFAARTCNFLCRVLKFSIFPIARTCALSLQSEPLTQHMRAKESALDREREKSCIIQYVCGYESVIHTQAHIDRARAKTRARTRAWARGGEWKRESLSWIRMTRTARQDARRSGKEDARHSLFLGGCLFRFYGEHNSKIRKGSCRDVTWRGLVVTWRLIRDWSYLLTFRVSLEKLTRAEHSN